LQEQLKTIEDRYERLRAEMNAPEVFGDPGAYGRLARECKAMEPLMEACRAYREALADLEAGAELGLPASELAEIREKISELELRLRYLMLPRDPRDEKSVIMEIRAGTGGEEAALFAGELFRMYSMYADRRGWTLETVNLNDTELGGIREIVFSVEGDGVFSRMKFESGAHCVKRVPVTESNGRIQTSTATVAVLPEAEESDFTLDMKDVKIDVFRSSGAGGQKVNKTSSAIRVTHLPTGTVVECQDERSQYRNKDRALSVLRSRLYEAELERQSAGLAAERRSQVGTGQRSEKIRTYFYLRGQVVDQRLEGDGRSFPLERILDGDLDLMIDRLLSAEQTERLRAQSE